MALLSLRGDREASVEPLLAQLARLALCLLLGKVAWSSYHHPAPLRGLPWLEHGLWAPVVRHKLFPRLLGLSRRHRFLVSDLF
jgi:hypothetical protein